MSLNSIIQTKMQIAPISFAEFMHLALYEPQYGYYNSANIFGASGDFVTAPIISPLFSKAIGKQCLNIMHSINNCYVLEFGAGNGMMAAQILPIIVTQQNFQQYLILEPSPHLRKMQQEYCQKTIPQYYHLITWLTALPSEPINAIVLANEVLDAMPVHKFIINDEIQEYFVTSSNDKYHFTLRKPSNPQQVKTIAEIQHKWLSKVSDYTLEYNFYLAGWLNSIWKLLKTGVVLISDYGFHDSEMYHPTRSMGTIMCHYHHQTNHDPLINIGKQDITSHVNFSVVSQEAEYYGFEISGYTSQASFLINNEIEKLITVNDTIADFQAMQALKILTLPTEMGELVKFIACTKDYNKDIQGFNKYDQSYLL